MYSATAIACENIIWNGEYKINDEGLVTGHLPATIHYKRGCVYMEKFKNYIIIDGKPVPQDEIPKEQMKEISKKLITRFAKGLGYKPVTKKELEVR